ncbi:MAG: alpha/beta fold hydrolase [Microcoleaceae cyanobacterium]
MRTSTPEAVWLNTSPSLRCFDQGLLSQLANKVPIGYWEYQQSLDEPSVFSIATTLVHDYLKSLNRPVHLIGHSTGGLIALLYAREHPERVKSLTLMAVGTNPTVDWKSHYYVLQQLLPYSRENLLRQMARICGFQSAASERKIARLLERDLVESFSPHSLTQRASFSVEDVSVPLFVCGSLTDNIVSHYEMNEWKSFLKEGDRLHQFPQGGHFFHYFFPEQIKAEIFKFWSSIEHLPEQQVRVRADCYN